MQPGGGRREPPHGAAARRGGEGGVRRLSLRLQAARRDGRRRLEPPAGHDPRPPPGLGAGARARPARLPARLPWLRCSREWTRMPFRRRARPDGRVYCARPQDHMRVTERVADLERANSELRERGAALEGRVLELERQVPLSPTLVQPRSALARAAVRSVCKALCLETMQAHQRALALNASASPGAMASCKICMQGVVPGNDASASTCARLER